MENTINDPLTAGNEQLARKEIVIDGGKFCDMEGFYSEIDNLLTRDLKWKTGHNLNAFDDILCGGFGVHEYGEPIKIIWKNYSKSKKDFGYEATVKYYKQMLACCHPSNTNFLQKKLSDAKNNAGETLLDIIIGIILKSDDAGHDCTLICESGDSIE